MNSTWEYYYVIRDRCHGAQKPFILDDVTLDYTSKERMAKDSINNDPTTYALTAHELIQLFGRVIGNTDVNNIHQSNKFYI